jgi:hypothetical protein
MLEEKTKEMLTGWDLDKKFKYLCFYHKAFPSMYDSWGIDYSDSKEQLLETEWGLFSSQDVSDYFSGCDEFRLVLSVMATDPQLLICSDGEYVLYDREYVFRHKYPSCDNPHKGWICVPAKFSRDCWKKLSSQYRRAVSEGVRLHRNHLLCYTEQRFEIAQRLVCQVFGDEIDTHEIKDEF